MEPDEFDKKHVSTVSALSSVKRYQGYVKHKYIVLLVLVIVVLALMLIAATNGSSHLSIGTVAAALVGQGDENAVRIVWGMRMPRILTAIVGGIALAAAGCAFQSVLRNPLASASTLGISQGAAFGASVAIIIFGAGGAAAAFEGVSFSNPYTTVICAFVGAIASTLVILALSRFREMTPEAIVLAGVALSALFAGGTALLQYFAEDTQVAAVVFWTFGSLDRVNYRELAIMGIIAAVSVVFFFFNRWNYNAMESGEMTAHGLGVNVKRTRLTNMLVAALAASATIAFCGTINFIGLVAPHIMRRFLGSDYRFLLPASALCGAALMLLSDLVCHLLVAPQILPISAITSIIGAPVFIYLLFKGVRR